MPPPYPHLSANDIYFLISGSCEYVTFHCKRDVTGVIELLILRWGDDPGFSGALVSYHRVLIRRKYASQSWRQKMEAEVREERRCHAAVFKDKEAGGINQKM